ncbi:hypothetical protein [Streptomyces prunicolor]|uniref:hypothetical protein n=1 Tax=Streptomyces prunicolor TaxID=67348 RepID=UPI0034064753
MVGLTFLFGFGNVWTLALRLGVPPWVAPLVAPAVDLSVMGLLLGTRYLALHGARPEQLRPARRLLVFSSVMTLALNVTDPLLAGQLGKAAFDAVGPLLLIGWVEVGPGLLQAIAGAHDARPAKEQRLVHNAAEEEVAPGSGYGKSLLPSRIDPDLGESQMAPGEGLLVRALQQDAWHWERFQRPISAETLRKRLRIGAARSRMLVAMVRSSSGDRSGGDTVLTGSGCRLRSPPCGLRIHLWRFFLCGAVCVGMIDGRCAKTGHRGMGMPYWFYLLGLADLFFVLWFFIYEVARLVLWQRIDRMERLLHALPNGRYFDRFATPLVTLVVGLAAGYGVNDMGEDGAEGFFGLLTVVAVAAALGQYHFREVTGTLPRPVPRARWRLELAEGRRVLDGDGVLLPTEATRLRARVVGLGGVGERLVHRAVALTWREALRRERWWAVGGVACAALLPLVTMARVVAVRGVHTDVAGAVALLGGMSAAVAVGAAARHARHRRELHALGSELRQQTRVLLDRMPAPAGGDDPHP